MKTRSSALRPLSLAALILLLLSRIAAAAPSEPEEISRVIDLRVPDAATTQRLTLVDGSQIVGRVESIAGATIVFRSIGGVTFTIARTDIADLRVVAGRVVNGEFLPSDSHNTRLLFAPTARALRKGEAYVGLYEVSLPFVQVGVTDRFSIGGGTPLYFGFGSDRPFWFTPKLQVLSTDRAQAAIGVIHVTGFGENAGIAYGVTTFGSSDQSLTAGLGFGYSGASRTPILMIGGDLRKTRRIKLVTENWFTLNGPGFVSGGVRFLGERLTADVGLMVPLVADDLMAFPLVSFAWHF
jgi:hypothetical protein